MSRILYELSSYDLILELEQLRAAIARDPADDLLREWEAEVLKELIDVRGWTEERIEAWLIGNCSAIE